MYLKQIFRSLIRDPFNTIVMIVSLTIGIFCSGLILSFILYELGTDNFHKDADRIYALKCDDPFNSGQKVYYCLSGSAEYMKKNYSDVEDFCRVRSSNALKIVADHKDFFDNPSIMAASENFFRFFSFDLITNNPYTVLESKNNIVISSDLAEKYFDSDPSGKVVTLVNNDTSETMIVTGVFKKSANNTQLKFDIVRQLEDTDSHCYIKLKDGSDPEALEKLLLEDKEKIPVLHMGNPGPYYLTPLRMAYFDIGRNFDIDKSRNIKDLWIAGIIGLLIIGVALFNYFGILANKFHKKTRECYIRRINGAPVSDMVFRFLIENLIIIAVSFMVVFSLFSDSLIFFNSLTGTKIPSEFIFQANQLKQFLIFFSVFLFITLIFILYLVRSNINLYSLKTNYNFKFKGIYIPFFNIFQLSASLALITCSLVIIKQLNYISKKPIGLDKNVFEVKIPAQYGKKAGVFKQELVKNSVIRKVSVTGSSPMGENGVFALEYMNGEVEKEYFPSFFNGDEDFYDVLGLKLLRGNGFEDHTPDTKICIVNRSFASLFPETELIGKKIPGLDGTLITGIVEDFNYKDLKSGIEPAFVILNKNGGNLLVKGVEGEELLTRKTIENVWRKIIPDYPVNIESIGERLEWLHRQDASFMRLLVSCSFISFFLSIIGLMAVTYQKIRSRTKEVGIRKINGAGFPDILYLVNKGFLIWVMIALILSAPVSWYAMHKWLETFAYKTDLSWWIFLLAGLFTLIITLFTVNCQMWNVTRRNPVESLRYE